MRIQKSTLRLLIMISLFCGLTTLLASWQEMPHKAQTRNMVFSSPLPGKESTISYKLIPAVNNTWGYDIIVDNHVKIHQPSIPGLPGNEGFKTKAGAEKVARLVISKLKKGEMPPTITVDEMKKLKAI